MSEPNQIVCPKCGSNQLSANKKGFSGKKAVAGAVLTGGIGLLAGTIGSNKIIITCLNCGHQFKPGDKPKPQASPEATAIGCGIFIVIAGLIFLVAKGCGGSSNDNNAISAIKMDTTKSIDTASLISSTLNIRKPNINYEIINKEINTIGQVNLMYIYIKTPSKLDSLNKYQDKDVYGFQIYYFNNRKIAKAYYKALFNNNVSDEEIDRLSTHIIGHYDYNKDDGGSLKLGKEAQGL